MEHLRDFTSKWLQVSEASTDGTTRLWHFFWTAIAYAPVVIVFSFCAMLWLERQFYEGQIVLISISLYVSLLFHAKLNYGIFPKVDYLAKIITLPIALFAAVVFKIIEYIFNALTIFFEVLFRLIGIIMIFAVIIFVMLGVVGVLLFGLRQIF